MKGVNSKFLTSAKYGEWQASLWGACLVAFALGAFLGAYLGVLVWAILIAGILLHVWGMTKIYNRNK
ncbi:MAG TPA: hypothetical protein VFT87_02655 [Candidatus Saccharimonadales bacterium]|nr:hypothetical protein [Candidatus Saccharimonadales bacterium]